MLKECGVGFYEFVQMILPFVHVVSKHPFLETKTDPIYTQGWYSNCGWRDVCTQIDKSYVLAEFKVRFTVFITVLTISNTKVHVCAEQQNFDCYCTVYKSRNPCYAINTEAFVVKD